MARRLPLPPLPLPPRRSQPPPLAADPSSAACAAERLVSGSGSATALQHGWHQTWPSARSGQQCHADSSVSRPALSPVLFWPFMGYVPLPSSALPAARRSCHCKPGAQGAAPYTSSLLPVLRSPAPPSPACAQTASGPGHLSALPGRALACDRGRVVSLSEPPFFTFRMGIALPSSEGRFKT